MHRRGVLAALGSTAIAGCTLVRRQLTAAKRLDCADGVAANPHAFTPRGERWGAIHQNSRNTGFAADRRGPDGCVDLQWVWQYPTDDVSSGSGMYTSPLVAGDTVLLGDESPYYADDSGTTPDNNSLIALDAATGRERWRLDAGFPAASTPALHGDRLVIPGNGELAVVDIAERTTLWTRDLVADGMDADTETFEAPVLTDDGVVYAASHTADIFALDAATGDLLWHFTSPGMAPANIPDDSAEGVQEAKRLGKFFEPIAVAGDTVYAATFGDAVHAVDRHTGERRWTFRLPLLTKYDRPLAPTIADGAVYVGTEAGLLYVLDADTGAIRWRYTEKRFGDGMSPGVDASYVYLTAGESSPETYLHALNRETHAVEWKTFVGRVNTGPAIDHASVFVGQGTILLAVDKHTGAEQWWFDLSTGTYSAPVIANGAVYMADVNGYVYGLW